MKLSYKNKKVRQKTQDGLPRRIDTELPDGVSTGLYKKRLSWRQRLGLRYYEFYKLCKSGFS